jgi:hypothetical protein
VEYVEVCFQPNSVIDAGSMGVVGTCDVLSYTGQGLQVSVGSKFENHMGANLLSIFLHPTHKLVKTTTRTKHIYGFMCLCVCVCVCFPIFVCDLFKCERKNNRDIYA